MGRRSRWRVLTTVGPGLQVHGPMRVENRGAIDIGRDVAIVSSPVRTHLSTGPAGRLSIGDGARIGHGGALSSVDRVEIGAGAVLGVFVMVMDSDFHVAGQQHAAPQPEPIYIGRGASVGHRTVVLPGAHVGDAATVDPGSVVSGRIADGLHVSGNPAVPIGTQSPGLGVRSVGDVVARVFGLAEEVDAGARPEQIDGWDSLGALRLLVELERAYDILLDDADLGAVGSVGDLEALVATAMRGR